MFDLVACQTCCRMYQNSTNGQCPKCGSDSARKLYSSEIERWNNNKHFIDDSYEIDDKGSQGFVRDALVELAHKVLSAQRTKTQQVLEQASYSGTTPGRSHLTDDEILEIVRIVSHRHFDKE